MRSPLSIGAASLLLAACGAPRSGPDENATPSPVEPEKAAPQAQASKPESTPAGASGVELGPWVQGTPEAVHRFKNGLRVEDYQVGQGPAAQVGSRLFLRYAGFLADGRSFEDNRSEHHPVFRFRLPRRPRVRGWGQGLLGMRAGGIRKIVVPPHLGYGEQGDKGEEGEPSVPPNATLTYVVKLLEIQPPEPQPKGPEGYQGDPIATTRLGGGLLLRDFALGKGPQVAAGDRVSIHYTGHLAKGTVFDSTLDSSPFAFVVGDPRFIAGWNQGLVGMRVGGRRTLEVPARLGYGKKGMGNIPPNAKLVFTVELMALNKGPKQGAAAVKTP